MHRLCEPNTFPFTIFLCRVKIWHRYIELTDPPPPPPPVVFATDHSKTVVLVLFALCWAFWSFLWRNGESRLWNTFTTVLLYRAQPFFQNIPKGLTDPKRTRNYRLYFYEVRLGRFTTVTRRLIPNAMKVNTVWEKSIMKTCLLTPFNPTFIQ